MGVVVAVEGPDKAGKSTFIRALREVRPFNEWQIMKMDVPYWMLSGSGTQLERAAEGWAHAMTYLKKFGLSFILDRCYVSSHVYAQEFGRSSGLGYIYGVAYELQPIIAYVRTPLDKVLARLEAEGDLIGGRARLVSLWEGYEQWYRRNPYHDTIVVVEGDKPAIGQAVLFKNDPSMAARL